MNLRIIVHFYKFDYELLNKSQNYIIMNFYLLEWRLRELSVIEVASFLRFRNLSLSGRTSVSQKNFHEQKLLWRFYKFSSFKTKSKQSLIIEKDKFRRFSWKIEACLPTWYSERVKIFSEVKFVRINTRWYKVNIIFYLVIYRYIFLTQLCSYTTKGIDDSTKNFIFHLENNFCDDNLNFFLESCKVRISNAMANKKRLDLATTKDRILIFCCVLKSPKKRGFETLEK